MTQPAIRVGAPAYFSPRYAPDDWTALLGAGDGSLVVVNPASGPAPGMRGDYRQQIREAQRRGVLVYGYVDVTYGRRRRRDVLREIGAYATALGVDGVFLDQVPADGARLRRLARLMRPVRGAGVRVAINPGQPEVAELALTRFDEVVVFEGDWDAYQRVDARCAAFESGGARRWHLVYGIPAGRSGEVVARARRLGADLVYATDKVLPNPWDGLPSGWDDMVEAINRAHTPSPPAGRHVLSLGI
jgi:Spherulation-specific family 4